MPAYLLPDVGEGLTEAEIVNWRVAVGDEVKVNDVVVEIETAKSLVELPSPYAGTVRALLVEEGQTVEVGTPIIEIVAADEKRPTEHPPIDLSNPAASGGSDGESLVGRALADRGAVRRARRSSSTPAASANTQRPLAKPAARLAARELGVDLASVAGTGNGGVITADDVRSAAEPASAPAAAAPARPTVPVASDPRETREPVKSVRKVMAEAMVSSAFTIPHVSEWVTVDVTPTTEAVRRLRTQPEYAGLKVTPLVLVARACIGALARYPLVNSWFDDAAQEIVRRPFVNLGIAAATPRGLVVPNVKDADSLSTPALAREIGRLVEIAREGHVPPPDLAGGTFAITNVGPFGVDGGTPIINPGSAAILCVGAIQRRPWVVEADGEERLAVRDVCTVALSFDHRHIDGETGSKFLMDVAGQLARGSAA